MIKTLMGIILLFFLSGPSWSNTEYKLLLNNPIGSGADRVARKLAKLVNEQSNISLYIINQGAAGGLMVARDFKSERLAVVIVNTSILIYGPLSGNSELTKFYSVKDFNIIADLGLASSVWYTYPDSGINTLDDLVQTLPKLKNAAIGVASQDSMANARALVNKNNLKIPVINFRTHNETVTQVAGKHIPVGVGIMNTESIYAMAKTSQIKILGHSGTESFVFRDFNLSSVSKHLQLPSFYGGSWLAITPGNSTEHIVLRNALLKAMNDPTLKKYIKEAWPLGDTVPFLEIQNTAMQNKDLFQQ